MEILHYKKFTRLGKGKTQKNARKIELSLVIFGRLVYNKVECNFYIYQKGIFA